MISKEMKKQIRTMLNDLFEEGRNYREGQFWSKKNIVDEVFSFIIFLLDKPLIKCSKKS